MRPIVSRLLPLFMLLLTCCTSSPPSVPPELTFTRYQPIYLDVGRIEFVNDYKSSGQPPYVEHLLPYSPEDALRIWVRDRIRAVGMDKSLQVIIKDASVIATELPKPSGVKGFFTLSQDKRYDAKLSVEMRIYTGEAMSSADVEVNVTHSVTIPINASVNDREAIFRRMIFDMMETANAELEKNIYKYFANYINYSH